MKIQRTLPPAAAPVSLTDLLNGLGGLWLGKRLIEKLEKDLRAYFDVKYVFLVSSGKAALTLILKSLMTFSRKRKVVIPAYTCFSVPSAVVKAGLQVALCDIDPETFDFDRPSLERAIGEETLCVIPNHLFGIPSDMDRVVSLCRKKGIFVVEDAAQAMGGTYQNKKLGTLGDVGFFSLGRGKNITCGSGGVILTNSDRIAAAIDHHYASLNHESASRDLMNLFQVFLMSIFIRPALYWIPQGIPYLELGKTVFSDAFPLYKLSGMKAGLLRRWKVRLEESNQMRMTTGNQFIETLALTHLRDVSVPYLRLPVLIESKKVRDALYAILEDLGFGVSCMYPSAVNEIQELKRAFDGQAFPSARWVSRHLITLPTHPLLSERDKKRICEAVQGIRRVVTFRYHRPLQKVSHGAYRYG